MYCSIRDYKDFEFAGDTSHIKEYIYPYDSMDMESKLKVSKDDSKSIVFSISPLHNPTEEEITEMRNLSNIRKNIRFLVPSRIKIPRDIPFFYGANLAASSLGELKALCEMGVTDVYIAGDLGFQMENVRKLADKFGIKVRIVPNIAQVSGYTFCHRLEGDNLTAFWVRPEDLDMYEKYVDVVEFLCENSKQNVFYDIYFQNKRWDGLLDTIISGVVGIDNRGLISPFTEGRLNCGNVCHIDKCHRCHRFNNSSKIIVENRLKVEKES